MPPGGVPLLHPKPCFKLGDSGLSPTLEFHGQFSEIVELDQTPLKPLLFHFYKQIFPKSPKNA